MSEPNGKQYKVLRDGVEQRGPNGERIKRPVGSIIEMSDAAAEHLVGDGWAEEVKQPKRRKAVSEVSSD